MRTRKNYLPGRPGRSSSSRVHCVQPVLPLLAKDGIIPHSDLHSFLHQEKKERESEGEQFLIRSDCETRVGMKREGKRAFFSCSIRRRLFFLFSVCVPLILLDHGFLLSRSRDQDFA